MIIKKQQSYILPFFCSILPYDGVDQVIQAKLV
jgi:hypothetical protein